MSQQYVTRDDIERKLREIQSGVEARVVDKKKVILGSIGGAAFVVLVIAYLLGRRAGRNKTTLVEIRRL
jgi:hypothetical protein